METGDSRHIGIFYIFYLLDTVLGTGDTWYAYIAVVLLKNDGGLDKGSSCGGGEKWSDSKDIVTLAPTGFSQVEELASAGE